MLINTMLINRSFSSLLKLFFKFKFRNQAKLEFQFLLNISNGNRIVAFSNISNTILCKKRARSPSNACFHHALWPGNFFLSSWDTWSDPPYELFHFPPFPCRYHQLFSHYDHIKLLSVSFAHFRKFRFWFASGNRKFKTKFSKICYF